MSAPGSSKNLIVSGLLRHTATCSAVSGLNPAMEKAVGEAVKKALGKVVEEQVQNAIGRSTQHDAETPVATIKTEEPSEGPTVIDLTEDQSNEIKIQEDSSTILDDYSIRAYLSDLQ